MPKEVIHTAGFHTVVGWGREISTIQLGVVVPPRIVEAKDGLSSQLEEIRLVDFVRDNFERNDAATGLFATFNSWDEINRTIRALQKARDSVHGRPA